MSDSLPWQRGASLLALVRAGGDAPDSVRLPTEGPSDLEAAGFGPGAIDGILSHHSGDFTRLRSPKERRQRQLTRSRERPAEILLEELRLLADVDTDAARLSVYRTALDDQLLGSIAELTRALRTDPELGRRLVPHARWLIDDGRHQGPVKLGLTLLGTAADGSDPADVDRVRLLARHPAFGLYGVVALADLLDDPVDELWAHAKATSSWRRIHSVERLAPLAVDRPDIQDWLLREGWQHSILDEYLAYACATGGDLLGALQREIDDELLDATCRIFEAMLPGGPRVPGIRDYDEAPEATAAWLEQLQRRCNSLRRLDAVLTIRRFLLNEDPVLGPRERWHNHDELVAACDRIALDPSWPARVQAAFDDGTSRGESLGWRLARELGLDWWDVLFARLASDSPGGARDRRIRQLARDARSEAQRRQLVAWAETSLPLDRIRDRRPGDERTEQVKSDTAALDALLHTGPGWPSQLTPPLLIAALRSPAGTSRWLATQLLLGTPRDDWGSGVAEAVDFAIGTEEDKRILDELRRLA